MNIEEFESIYQTLTERQQEVLHLFLAGHNDRHIAKSLSIIEDTVRQHLRNICLAFRLMGESPDERRRTRRTELMALFAYHHPKQTGRPAIAASTQIWGDIPNISEIFGRTGELEQLEQWITHDNCRLVGILGMGGIGKTTVASDLVRRIQNKFEYIIWKAIREPIQLADLLTSLIIFFADRLATPTNIPDSLDGKISKLLNFLREKRCLLVLDNIESIMAEGRAGFYSEGYEAYGEFLKRIVVLEHQSCLLVISRETPSEIALLDRKQPAHLLKLTGLKMPEGKKIFTGVGNFSATDDEWRELIEYYAGNPLALTIVASVIRDTLDGNISQFIQEYLNSGLLSEIRDILDAQINRLSDSEREIIYWLSINREPVSAAELRKDIVSSQSRLALLDSLLSLTRRSIIEVNSISYTLQPVLMKYVTAKFVTQIVNDLTTGEIGLFENHALMKAKNSDYLRDLQINLFIQPVLQRLLQKFGTQENLENHLKTILLRIIDEAPQQRNMSPKGNAVGNLINLFRYLGTDLSGYDLSNLTIKQADLRNSCQNISFRNSHLEDCLFSSPLGSILWVVFNPSGRILAAGDVNGSIHLWNLSQNNKHSLLDTHYTFKGHESWLWTIRFSPDEQYLASAGDDQNINIWDVQSQQIYRVLPGHEGSIRSLSFNQDGILASASDDRTIKLWNIHTGECIQTLLGHDSIVRSVSFNPQNPQILASASDDETVRIWQVDGECLRIFSGHIGDIRTICFSPDGQLVASAGNDKKIRIWQVINGECIVLEGHANWVRSVDFSPDGQFLVSASEDKTIKLWNVKSSECVKIFYGHSSWVQSVRFNPDGQTFASGGADRMVKLWDLNQGCLTTLEGYTNCLFTLAFSPDGETLASGHEDRTIRLWNLNTLQYKTLQGHTDWVRSVTFSANGEFIASSSGDRTVRLWNLKSGECKIFEGHESWIRQVRFSPDDRILASSSDDRMIKIWDIETGNCIQTLQGHQGWVRSIAFAPHTQILASAGKDCTVKIWDIQDLQNVSCIQTLQGHKDWVWSVAFSPNGEILASASGDKTIKLWYINDGCWKNFKTLSRHTKSIRSVVFSADGKILASGSVDRKLVLWDTTSWEPIGNPKEHNDWIRSIAFSSTGNLASAGQDGIIQLWNLRSSFKTIKLPNLYEGMDFRGATGLTPLQTASLKALGAKLT